MLWADIALPIATIGTMRAESLSIECTFHTIFIWNMTKWTFWNLAFHSPATFGHFGHVVLLFAINLWDYALLRNLKRIQRTWCKNSQESPFIQSPRSQCRHTTVPRLKSFFIPSSSFDKKREIPDDVLFPLEWESFGSLRWLTSSKSNRKCCSSSSRSSKPRTIRKFWKGWEKYSE